MYIIYLHKYTIINTCQSYINHNPIMSATQLAAAWPSLVRSPGLAWPPSVPLSRSHLQQLMVKILGFIWIYGLSSKESKVI